MRRKSETRVRDGSEVRVRRLVSGKVVGDRARGRERRETRARGRREKGVFYERVK